MQKTIYELSSGRAITVEAVDAKEILRHSPDLYTEVKPESATDAEADAPAGPALNGAGEPAPHERKLGIAELRALLTARGVAFDEGAKKGDLQALLDAHNAA